MAFSAVKPGCGHCVLAGNLPQGETIAINPFDLILGKKIAGTWGGSTDIDRDVLCYIDLFLEKQSALCKAMISHEVPLHEINALMTALFEGKIGRGFIAFPCDAASSGQDACKVKQAPPAKGLRPLDSYCLNRPLA